MPLLAYKTGKYSRENLSRKSGLTQKFSKSLRDPNLLRANVVSVNTALYAVDAELELMGFQTISSITAETYMNPQK